MIVRSPIPTPKKICPFDVIGDVTISVAINIAPNIIPPDNNWNPESPTPRSSSAPYRIYNIGNNAPVNLMEFITEIESSLGQVAEKNFMDMQPGDVESTYADTTGLMNDFNYSPSTSLNKGVANFVNWYREFYT